MSPERMEICRKCLMLPSIHHLDYPVCEQPIRPINDEEWKESGLKPDEPITANGLLRMMNIAMTDYCREKMLRNADFQAWLRE